MKIVCVDNFDRDYKADQLVCENVDGRFLNIIVDFLNSREPIRSDRFFKAFPDTYKLHEIDLP